MQSTGRHQIPIVIMSIESRTEVVYLNVLKRYRELAGLERDRSGISEEMHDTIAREMDTFNALRSQYVLIVTFIFELTLILLHDLPQIRRTGSMTGEAGLYLLMHIVIALVACSGVLLARKVLTSPGSYMKSRHRSFNRAVAFMVFIILSASAVINSLDQSLFSSITVYTSTVLLVSVLVILKPPLNLFVFLGSYAIFAISMFIYTPAHAGMQANLINGSFIVAAAIIVSTSYFRSFSESTAKSVMLREANRQLEIISNRDVLTGLYNRRFFYDFIQQELQYLKRYNDECSLVIFDLDDFKQVNDRFGHTYGDLVLKTFAGILTAHCRESDLAIRWGGEEFVMVLFKASTTDAHDVVKRILSAQEQMTNESEGRSSTVTASAGVVNLQRYSATGIDEAIIQANRALYQAKREGKNRVISAEALPAAEERL
jgi:diguanylate cyclase